MIKIAMLVMLGLGFMTFYSCTKDKAVPPAAGAVCDSTKVRYEQNIKPIMDAHCSQGGCHDGVSQPPSLISYGTVKSGVSDGQVICRIEGQCNQRMPIGRPLSQATIDTIIKWKSDGYCEK